MPFLNGRSALSGRYRLIHNDFSRGKSKSKNGPAKTLLEELRLYFFDEPVSDIRGRKRYKSGDTRGGESIEGWINLKTFRKHTTASSHSGHARLMTSQIERRVETDTGSDLNLLLDSSGYKTKNRHWTLAGKTWW